MASISTHDVHHCSGHAGRHQSAGRGMKWGREQRGSSSEWVGGGGGVVDRAKRAMGVDRAEKESERGGGGGMV